VSQTRSSHPRVTPLHRARHASRNRNGTVGAMWKPKCALSHISEKIDSERVSMVFVQWVQHTGSGSALNTASPRKASSRIGPPRAVIARTSSFTKQMMSTIFRAQSSWILNREYVCDGLFTSARVLRVTSATGDQQYPSRTLRQSLQPREYICIQGWGRRGE
jgi:hypothetical protein